MANFREIGRWLGIVDKGYGALYLDDQPCNYLNYEKVTGELMRYYGVSREAVAIRLETFGLLRDARSKGWKSPFKKLDCTF